MLRHSAVMCQAHGAISCCRVPVYVQVGYWCISILCLHRFRFVLKKDLGLLHSVIEQIIAMHRGRD